MPLPLPVMIPFMMWQSAAIAAGFGTYFQYAKRRVSAMSNDEFNASNPHDLVDALYKDIVAEMPSSFKQIESMTPIILDSMLKMLTDAVKWFSSILGGSLDHPFHFGEPGHHDVVDPILPEPDVNVALLNPSSATITGWPVTKLNVIHNSQLHLYSLEAQKIIKSLFNARNRDSIIDNEPRVEIPTLDLPDFFKTLTTKNYPKLHRIALDKIANSGSYAKAIQLASVQWTASRFKSINERSQTSRDVFLAIKLEWGRLIVNLNKAASEKLPFKL